MNITLVICITIVICVFIILYYANKFDERNTENSNAYYYAERDIEEIIRIINTINEEYVVGDVKDKLHAIKDILNQYTNEETIN